MRRFSLLVVAGLVVVIGATGWRGAWAAGGASTRPTTGPDAARYYPLRKSDGAVRETTKGGATTVPFTMDSSDQGWTLTYRGHNVLHLRVGNGGDIELTSEDDLDEGVHMSYDPALVIFPARRDAAHPPTGTSKMVVTRLKDGGKKADGKVTWKLEDQGESDVTTPAGKYHVVTIKASRSMKLSIADVEATVTSKYAPGVGVVWEEESHQTKMLGLGGGKSTETRERVK